MDSPNEKDLSSEDDEEVTDKSDTENSDTDKEKRQVK